MAVAAVGTCTESDEVTAGLGDGVQLEWFNYRDSPRHCYCYAEIGESFALVASAGHSTALR